MLEQNTTGAKLRNGIIARSAGRAFVSVMPSACARSHFWQRTTHALFAAFDVLALTARDKAGAANIQRMNASQYKIRNNGIHIARVLINFDALKALLDAGKLTAKEVVKICYPEIKNPGKDMLKAVNYGVKFGDGTTFAVSSEKELKGNAEKVADKIVDAHFARARPGFVNSLMRFPPMVSW